MIYLVEGSDVYCYLPLGSSLSDWEVEMQFITLKVSVSNHNGAAGSL